MQADQQRRRAGRLALPGWVWAVAGAAIGLAALLYSCRGAPLGLPVADDFAYYFRLVCGGRLDLFDSMGAPASWRPVSRQLYFGAIGHWLLSSPWGVTVVHGGLLVAIYAVIFAAARRRFAAPVAAAIATFPLLAEPSRVLISRPSGAPYLLVTLAVALGVWAALSGRRVLAALATLVAFLVHEAALLLLPVLPLVAWLRTRDRRATITWAGIALALAILWGAGWQVARTHGVAYPSPTPESGGAFWSRVPLVLTQGLVAQLNLEDLEPVSRGLLVLGYAALGITALVLALAPVGRARLRRIAPLIVFALAWFVAGSLPEALTPPWSAWRGTLPALGLGVALTCAVGVLNPRLAVGLVVLRLVALGLAPSAPAEIARTPPDASSEVSFTRLVRHQRLVEASRIALLDRFPTLPTGGKVLYLGLPAADEIAFLDGHAPRVWYADSTLIWRTFGSATGFRRRAHAILQFSPGHKQLAVVIEPEALSLWMRSRRAFQLGQGRVADSLFALTFVAQPHFAPYFFAQVARDQARVAYNFGDRDRADSLNQLDLRWGGPGPYHAAMEARLAFDRGDRQGAIRWLQECLNWDRDNREAQALFEDMGLRRSVPDSKPAPGDSSTAAPGDSSTAAPAVQGRTRRP